MQIQSGVELALPFKPRVQIIPIRRSNPSAVRTKRITNWLQDRANTGGHVWTLCPVQADDMSGIVKIHTKELHVISPVSKSRRGEPKKRLNRPNSDEPQCHAMPRSHNFMAFLVVGHQVNLRQPGLWLPPLFMGFWAEVKMAFNSHLLPTWTTWGRATRPGWHNASWRSAPSAHDSAIVAVRSRFMKRLPSALGNRIVNWEGYFRARVRELPPSEAFEQFQIAGGEREFWPASTP